MKILMINVVCGIRSTGRICTDLAEELEKKGHTVKIAYGRESVPEKYQKYAVRIGSDTDVKLHALQARITDSAGFHSRKATEEFLKWVDTFQPDVVHLHNLHGYYIHIGMLFEYLKSHNIKVIWTMHDSWAFTGHTPFCDAINCSKWMTGCGHCPGLHQYPKSILDKSADNWKKKQALFQGLQDMTIVTPSRWLARMVRQSFLSEYFVRIIHNGIDTSQFHYTGNSFKEQHGISDKIMLLGVASSWDNLKGLRDFCQLAERLDNQYKIVLVGVTKEQAQQLSENILSIERTNNIAELVDIYSAADALLNLSYCENYPTINLESICCGTPVITYDTGGSKESLDKETGTVVTKGNMQELIQAIERIRANASKLTDIDTNLFDKAETTAQYLKLYPKQPVACAEDTAQTN